MEKTLHKPVFYQTGYRNGVKGVLTKAFCKFLKAGEQDVIYDTQMTKTLKFPPPGTALGSRGMSHYGIMISDLPAPHHFMANMILIGYSGWKAWDDDSLLQSNAKNTISIGHGTAITTHDPLLVIDRMRSNLREDGSLLHFSDEYELRCEYPKFYLKSHVGSFKTDLELTSTDVISWAGSSEMYRHFSLMCTYQGLIEFEGQLTSVNGLCTFEYGTGYLPYMDLKRPLPKAFKLPANFFTYHVINLSATQQLLFCVVGAYEDQSASVVAELRDVNEGAKRFGKRVTFDVLEFRDNKEINPRSGEQMSLPQKFRWTIEGTSDGTIYIDCQVDSSWLYAAMGYIAGYTWTSNMPDHTEGRGYFEYSDRRD